MTTTKTTKIVYWTTTGIIFLFEGVVPALTSHTQVAVEGIRHLGYPDYFRVMLTIFKVLGALALVLPFTGKIKEWAYVGFALSMTSAFVSHWVVDGFGAQTLFPLFVLGILIASYIFQGKLSKLRNSGDAAFNTNQYVISGVPQ